MTPTCLALATYVVDGLADVGGIRHVPRVVWRLVDVTNVLLFLVMILQDVGDVGNIMIGLDMVACTGIRQFSLSKPMSVLVWLLMLAYLLSVRWDNVNLIFLPSFDSNLTRVQFVSMAIYYFGTCLESAPPFYRRIVGALNVATLVE